MRYNLTLPVVVGALLVTMGATITAIIEFSSLRKDVNALTVAIKDSQSEGKELAALQAQVAALDARLTRQEDHFDWAALDQRNRKRH